ncbi:hypothetical protein XBI1_2290003 [Xenorhabdus bovienii str. Intermedium]|uniref:Uncharacterized protein n=1 Tax=Xenorhabdus bovienii str. Intermedium TaxID=1379677 RepID=A0A077QHH5_XENBV|nr:hypothetical protein XBI1_2290003 [Xenorhabdus bovienii str. Intermedium]
MLVVAYLLSLAIKGVVKIAIGLNFMLLLGVIWYILSTETGLYLIIPQLKN